MRLARGHHAIMTGTIRGQCWDKNRPIPPFTLVNAIAETPVLLVFVVPIVGIELTTYRLQGGCSTN